MDCTASDLIQEKSMVIVKNDKDFHSFKVKANRKYYMDKMKFTLDAIIGEPYGSRFQCQSGALVKLTNDSALTFNISNNVCGVDNRDLLADPTNQNLSSQEIEELKQSGLSGNDIVGKIIQNSKTFQTKTTHSQEKYIKKKKSKYDKIYTVERPSPRLLCKIYNPRKTCNLREDMLAEILLHSNLVPNSTVAVVDSYCGIVLASVLLKMAGSGRVLNIYCDNSSIRPPALSDLNLTTSELQNLYSIPLNVVSQLKSHNKVLHQQNDPLTVGRSLDGDRLLSNINANANIEYAKENNSIKGDTTNANEAEITGINSSPFERKSNKFDTSIMCSEKGTEEFDTANVCSDVSKSGIFNAAPSADDGSSAVCDRMSSDRTDDGSSAVCDRMSSDRNDDGSSAVCDRTDDGSSAVCDRMSSDRIDDSSSAVCDRMSSDKTDDGSSAVCERMSPDRTDDGSSAVCDRMSSDRTDLNVTRTSDSHSVAEERVKRRKNHGHILKNSFNVNAAQEILSERSLDGLIIASKYHPVKLVENLYEYLAPSRPIVIHCRHIEPLMDVHELLVSRGWAVNVVLSENFYRHFQVLPERTHPCVNTSTSGGYLLTATTIKQ